MRRGPEFHLMATSTIQLTSIEDDVRSHDLLKETVEEAHALPFFGQVYCMPFVVVVVVDVVVFVVRARACVCVCVCLCVCACV